MDILNLLATEIRSGQLPRAQASSGQINSILVIIFQTIGALALLMLVISGLRYTFSAGDPQKAKQARDGIIYSLVGITVAIFATAIVSLVENNL